MANFETTSPEAAYLTKGNIKLPASTDAQKTALVTAGGDDIEDHLNQAARLPNVDTQPLPTIIETYPTIHDASTPGTVVLIFLNLSGGTYKLTDGTETSGDITHSRDLSESLAVIAALEAFASIAPGDVSNVSHQSGGSIGGTPDIDDIITITFPASAATIPTISVASESLTPTPSSLVPSAT